MHKDQVHILLTQKTKSPFVKEGIHHYVNKLFPFASIKVLEPKSGKSYQQMCKKMEKETVVILLDEKGRQFSSTSFAQTWQSLINQRTKDISFIIGGAHGFNKQPRADVTLSLSNLTYNHELVPLVVLEQVYRAYSIMKGLPYHHA